MSLRYQDWRRVSTGCHLKLTSGSTGRGIGVALPGIAADCSFSTPGTVSRNSIRSQIVSAPLVSL